MHRNPPRDCFICHASEDKDAVARPIAEALVEADYEVWFDEYELVLGDSLREKIDEGLARSRFGVVILSKSFFANRWPQAELDGLFAREMVGGERLIFPVWHGIDEEFLAAKSPLLAGRLGVASRPVGDSAARIAQAIDRRRVRGSTAAAIIETQAGHIDQATPEIVGMVDRSEGLKLRLKDSGLGRFMKMGTAEGPPCLSIVAAPVRLQPDLIDPTEVSADALDRIYPDELWSPAYLGDFGAAYVDHTGFRWSVGPSSDQPPQWRRISENGLMEYGVDLSRRGKPIEPNREGLLPMTLAAHLIHDQALFFLNVLEKVGFHGEAAVIASFDNLHGCRLGLDLNHYFPVRETVKVERLVSRPLRGSVSEILTQVGKWTRRTMDRLLLTAERTHGFQEIDESGERRNLPDGHRIY